MAHEDIQPSTEWQIAIQRALASMDAFVVLLTSECYNSEWIDQEIGYAVAREVPIVAVRIGQDPRGFIGRLRGLSCSWDTAHDNTIRILINDQAMVDSYIDRISKCRNVDEGNNLGRVLPMIKKLTPMQFDRLVRAYNSNDQLRGSYAFSGGKPRLYGPGLVEYLNEQGTKKIRNPPPVLLRKCHE